MSKPTSLLPTMNHGHDGHRTLKMNQCTLLSSSSNSSIQMMIRQDNPVAPSSRYPSRQVHRPHSEISRAVDFVSRAHIEHKVRHMVFLTTVFNPTFKKTTGDSDIMPIHCVWVEYPSCCQNLIDSSTIISICRHLFLIPNTSRTLTTIPDLQYSG